MTLVLLVTSTIMAPSTEATGDEWEIQCSDSPSGTTNYLFGVAAHADDAVVAVGSKYVSGNHKPLAELWEPTEEQTPCFVEKSTPSVSGHSELNAVTRVPSASPQRHFWAVGYQGGSSRTWNADIGDWTIAGATTLIERSTDGGETWSIVSSPNPSGATSSVLRGVSARASNDVWAVGHYTTSTGQFTLIQHWNGSAWSIVSSPNESGVENYLRGVSALEDDYAWAVGFTHDVSAGETFSKILRWNGTSWSAVSHPQPGEDFNQLGAVTAISEDQAHAVGTYFPETGAKDTEAQYWDGEDWTVETTPSPEDGANVLLGVAPVSDNDIWAVGSAEDPPHKTLTARRVNGTWSQVTSPNASNYNNQLFAVAVVPGTNICAGGYIWAVGYYDYSNTGTPKTLAMRYYITPGCNL
ncbi:MAG: hypothetical protein WCD37_18210 [Chloroflexia bacterium]